MKYSMVWLSLVTLLPACAGAENELWSPGFPPSQVDASGTLHEPWGAFGLILSEPQGAGAAEQHYETSPIPVVRTIMTSGTVTLAQTAFRAPIYPGGVDVLLACASNTGAQPAEVKIALTMPDGMNMGTRVGVANNQQVLGLPLNLELTGKERAWGCAGGAVAMSGWAAPQGECDAAFKNISAGLGGIPIVYHFSVPKGEQRTVALGFCESFHMSPGKRPLMIDVEGTETQALDPLALWGRHVPGCLRFDAADANQDGHIDVTVGPHPNAEDQNPILNAVWVFPAGFSLEDKDLIAGKLNGKAEYFVDVGGQQDQALYEPGSLGYVLSLAPGASQEFLFLLSSPGGGPVPNPETMSWTPDSLRKAAEEVAKSWKE